MDESLTDYATRHNELPILIRWNGERAIGLFEEWYDIKGKSTPTMEQMSQIHAVYRLYLLPAEEFGLYFMCFGYDQVDHMELPLTIDKKQASDIRKSSRIPYEQTLTNYVSTLTDHIRNFSDNSVEQFYETLRVRRTQFHKVDSELVIAIQNMKKAIDSHLLLYPLLSCVTITDLFEELPYTSVVDIWHRFDQARLTTHVPFCTYSGFYKMMDSVSMKSDWSPSATTHMTVYIQKGQYDHCIYIHPDNVVIQSTFQVNGETPTEVIQLINDTFALDLKPDPTHQKKIQALCYVDANTKSPFLSVNLKMLLLFIYQDPLFSRFLFAEERLVVMKDKTYLYFTYYPNPRIPTRFISFTIRNVEKEEAVRLTCDFPVKKGNKPLLRIKIRHCSNQTDITQTLEMISLVVSKYRSSLNDLQDDLRANSME